MAGGVQIGRGYIAVDVEDSKARAALSKFGEIGATALKAVGVAAGVVSVAAVKMAFDFNSLKEQSLIAFETMLGSGQKAQQMFSNLQKFAAATPFELPGLVDNARQLLGVGVAADKVIPTLTALGDTAGALGINQDHFNNILLATTQAMGKGKLQGEELMQMVENGIPVWQLLSKATGKTVPELQKLSSQGKLLSADVLPKLYAQMEKDYGGSMAKQSMTLNGVWSSLKDNTKSLLGTALEPLFQSVKGGVGYLGELAQSDAAQTFATKFAAGLGHASDTATHVYNVIKDNYGDKFKQIFDTAKGAAGGLWDTFKDNAGPALKSAFDLIVKILPALISLGQAASGILKPALEAVKTVFTALGDNADQFASLIRTAASVVSAIAGPAISIFGGILKVVADIIAGLVHFVGDLPGPLGVLTGLVIAGAVAWRLFGTAIGTVGTAFNAVKPSAVEAGLSSMSKKIDDVSLSAGVMTERLTGSANAGQKVAVAGSKVGSFLQKAGSYLPLVGVGFAALGAVWGLMSQHASDLHKEAEGIGQGLAIGGSAAIEANKKLKDLQKTIDDTRASMTELAKAQPSGPSGGYQGDFSGVSGAKSISDSNDIKEAKKQIAEAQAALKDYQAELGPVGLAQARVTQAQKDYNTAVQAFGPSSSEAALAQKGLVAETSNLNQAQINAAKSAKTQEQNLYDLATAALAGANADLQLRQSQNEFTKSLDDLGKVQKDGKHTTAELSDAQLNLEGTILRAAGAARAKAEADNQGKDATVIAAASNKAYAGELLTMAAAAGTNAPASLQKLIGNLDAASLSALGAKIKVDGAGNAIISLPDGKNIPITAENAQALNEIARVQNALDAAKAHAQITITARLAGGLPAISDQKARARGGNVSGGESYWVGEEGPELFHPDRSGYISTHQDSMKITTGAKGGGDTWNLYEQSDPYSTAMNVQRIQQFNGRQK